MLFFADAREHLVGARPQDAGRSNAKPIAAEPTGDPRQPADTTDRWSMLVDADTLTAEIRRIVNQLTVPLKKSASFQGGGNLVCRRNFGLLAVLFGVVDQFDQQVRWQGVAKQMRDRCLQASNNCKAASTQSYAAALDTKIVLEELLRGQAPADDASGGSTEERPPVDRALLMQSMKLAVKERLSPALANSREFRKRAQLATEQAQLLAVLAKVIQQEGYDYVDDDTYLDEARQLGQAALELNDAAREKNYEAARAAAGKVGQSCSRCHEDFRG